jgi:hypothetical protein
VREGEDILKELSMVECFSRRKEFFLDREPDFPVLFKNDQKLTLKKVLPTQSKEQHQTLKRTEIITYIKRVVPSSRPFSLR